MPESSGRANSEATVLGALHAMSNMIAQRLKEVRLKHGLDFETAAKRCNCHAYVIRRSEKQGAANNFTLATLYRFRVAYNVPINALLGPKSTWLAALEASSINNSTDATTNQEPAQPTS